MTLIENRLIALKWEDAEYETIFRGVELATGRTGTVEINAIFDPVDIGGMMVRRANVHGLSGFEKLKLGVGDTIKVYKANMIVPQVSENLTKSGTFKLSEFCPCCGAKLEIKISNTGVRSLYCPNEDCLARNAQKIARFCDKKAMNIEGLNAANISAFAEKYPEHKKRNLLLSDRISQNSVKNIIENIFEINEDDGQADTMQQDWTRLTDDEIRYAIPEYFDTIVDVERAIELAIED